MSFRLPVRISPLNSGSQPQHMLQQWPPPDDFPVILDWQGEVLSRFADSTWDLTPWYGMPFRLNFGDGGASSRMAPLTPFNARALRLVVGWWLWGPHSVQVATTLAARFDIVRPVFSLCSREGISVTELSRYPKVVEKISESLAPSRAAEALTHFHDLWEQREALGFHILDLKGLAQVRAALATHEKAQTPYIPPRIWLYQVSRLRAFLDDFLAHRNQIEACYHFCLQAYAANAGSLEAAVQHRLPSHRQPFGGGNQRLTGARTGAAFPGTFDQVAERFGIRALLENWTAPKSRLDIQQLTSYFTCATYVGIAYLLNFSLMRIGEAWDLRSSCLSIENDALGDIYLLKGRVSKTGQDQEAWIASPSSVVAIEVMRSVAGMRMAAGAGHPTVKADPTYMADPHLVVRPYEPWRGNCVDLSLPLEVRTSFSNYAIIPERWPRVIDPGELRVTARDLDAARLLTPSLDPERISLGEPWPLAWHQLRRTGAVNMNASGVVSEPSVQYQLKHTTRMMSRYYGQGYRHVRFHVSEEGRSEYIRAMYDVVAREFAELKSDRFKSPYGDEHKNRLLSLVSQKNHKELVNAAKDGRISYRETLLGGCMNPAPCDKGGVDSVAACGGGHSRSPCEHLLYDHAKQASLKQLAKVIALRLVDAPPSSPLHESLVFQQQNVEHALDAFSA